MDFTFSPLICNSFRPNGNKGFREPFGHLRGSHGLRDEEMQRASSEPWRASAPRELSSINLRKWLASILAGFLWNALVGHFWCWIPLFVSRKYTRSSKTALFCWNIACMAPAQFLQCQRAAGLSLDTYRSPTHARIDWESKERIAGIVNMMVASPEIDFWAIIGDNFYESNQAVAKNLNK